MEKVGSHFGCRYMKEKYENKIMVSLNTNMKYENGYLLSNSVNGCAWHYAPWPHHGTWKNSVKPTMQCEWSAWNIAVKITCTIKVDVNQIVTYIFSCNIHSLSWTEY